MKPISEAEFLDQVIQFAKLHGWKVAHFRPARVIGKGGKPSWRTPCQGDAKGFPDLVMVRGPGFAVRLVVVELKSAKGKLTAEQHAWLGAFEAAGVPAYIFSPADWPEIERVLGA